MKKIIIFIILFCLIIGTVYFIGFRKNNFKEIPNPDNLSLSEGNTEMKEVKVGNMVLDIPLDISFKNENNLLTLYLLGVYKDETSPNYINHTMEVSIHFMNKANEQNLPIYDWFVENDPQILKTSATSEYDEEKVLNDIYYMESLYQAPTSMQVSHFYDVVLDYFKDKKDIYTVTYFKKSGNPKITLSNEEQKSIVEYEKIVDEIIHSIRFVE